MIEAMIAISILAIIGVLTYGTFSRAMDARDRANRVAEHYHEVRQGMLRMAREISMAYLSRHKNCDDPRSDTLFVTSRQTGGTRLVTPQSNQKRRLKMLHPPGISEFRIVKIAFDDLKSVGVTGPYPHNCRWMKIFRRFLHDVRLGVIYISGELKHSFGLGINQTFGRKPGILKIKVRGYPFP